MREIITRSGLDLQIDDWACCNGASVLRITDEACFADDEVQLICTVLRHAIQEERGSCNI